MSQPLPALTLLSSDGEYGVYQFQLPDFRLGEVVMKGSMVGKPEGDLMLRRAIERLEQTADQLSDFS